MRGWITFQVAPIVSQNSDELFADIVGLFESSEVEVGTPAPFLVHPLSFKCVEDIYHSNVITVRVGKLGLLSVRNLSLVLGSDEYVRHVEASYN